jgi:hypothetical protein
MRQNFIDELAWVMAPLSLAMKAAVRSLRPEKSEATMRSGEDGACAAMRASGAASCAVCGSHRPERARPGSPA